MPASSSSSAKKGGRRSTTPRPPLALSFASSASRRSTRGQDMAQGQGSGGVVPGVPGEPRLEGEEKEGQEVGLPPTAAHKQHEHRTQHTQSGWQEP
jgi:hypothetical protein